MRPVYPNHAVGGTRASHTTTKTTHCTQEMTLNAVESISVDSWIVARVHAPGGHVLDRSSQSSFRASSVERSQKMETKTAPTGKIMAQLGVEQFTSAPIVTSCILHCTQRIAGTH